MTKILVTGATGELGRHTLNFLLQRVPASDVAALAREPAKLKDFAARGVDVRQGDYFDPESLERAFKGIDRLLFISAVTFTDMLTQHRNIIAAANAAGVKHIVYTGIQQRDGSSVTIDQVSDVGAKTEALLAASDANITILRNSTYMEALPIFLGLNAIKNIRLPFGDGAVALVARRDLGEANAAVLTTEGHEGKTYTLTGSVAVTMDDLAKIVSTLTKQTMTYTPISAEDFIAERRAIGLPEPVAVFLASWMQAIAAGEFAEVTNDLEKLIGHPATPIEDILPTLGLSIIE